jgi:hypothetical protein
MKCPMLRGASWTIWSRSYLLPMVDPLSPSLPKACSCPMLARRRKISLPSLVLLEHQNRLRMSLYRCPSLGLTSCRPWHDMRNRQSSLRQFLLQTTERALTCPVCWLTCIDLRKEYSLLANNDIMNILGRLNDHTALCHLVKQAISRYHHLRHHLSIHGTVFGTSPSTMVKATMALREALHPRKVATTPWLGLILSRRSQTAAMRMGRKILNCLPLYNEAIALSLGSGATRMLITVTAHRVNKMTGQSASVARKSTPLTGKIVLCAIRTVLLAA